MSGSQIVVPNYPTSNLVPGVYFSVSPTNANNAPQLQPTLIIGQVLTGGTYALGSPIQIAGLQDVITGSGGAGSMLAIDVARYLKSDPLGDVWVLPLADDGAATKTVITLTFTGPATGSGAVALMIDGVLVFVPVTAAQTAAAIATAAAALINAMPGLPVSAAATAAVCTLTALNAGAAAGDIPVLLNFYGSAGGQVLPAGVGLTITTATQGATNPSTALTAAIPNLGPQRFDFIVMPYTDTTSLNLIDALLDPVTGRWSWSQQIYGGAFSAVRGTVGTLGTFAAARDDKFISFMGFNGAPQSAHEWAADYAGACAASLRASPALPLGGAGDGVDMTVIPPPISSQFTFASQQTLLAEGIATYVVEPGGVVRVQRAVNNYTLNPAGQPDTSYQQVETTYTLMACLRDMLAFLSSIYGRKELVDDGTVISGGSNMVAAQTILQSVIARYQTQCNEGLAQGYAAFAAAAQAQNVGNGVVYLYLPYNLANQLFVIAGNVSFFKS